MKRLTILSAALAGVALLGGCNSDSDDATGKLTLSITDAPVDDASAVWVQFSGVELKRENGEVISLPYATPRKINLLALQDGLTDKLLDQQSLPSGRYEWLRIMVDAEFDGIMDSYLVHSSGQSELRVPSGAQSGLKLVRGFVIPEAGSANFTVDFDLRQSLTQPAGQPGYYLKPVLRLIDNAQSGALEGMVAPALITSACTATSGTGAVYIFSGADVIPDDIDTIPAEPAATARVALQSNGEYRFKVAYLAPGSYTVAYTCQASSDVADASDNLTFFGSANITVINGQTSSKNFS